MLVTGFVFLAIALGGAWLTRQNIAFYGGSRRVRAGFLAWYLAALAMSSVFALHPELPFPVWLIPLSVLSGTITLTLLSQRVLQANQTLQQRYRVQTMRLYFGLLILVAAQFELVPPAFAYSAGIGDVAVGAIAFFFMQSGTRSQIAATLFTVFGMVDLLNALRIGVTVVVPWLAATHQPGVLLMLPFFVVPNLMSHHLQLLLRLRASAAADQEHC